MNPTLKNTVIAGVIALVVVLGVYWFTQPAVPVAQLGATTTAIPEPGGTVLPNGQVLPNPSTSDYTVERVYDAMFALGLWDNTSNPVHIQAVRVAAFVQATTTPCSMQSPFTTATSTIISSTFFPTTSTSTAYQDVMATSSSQYLNTSPFFTQTEAANTITDYVAGETASSTGLGLVIPPSGWVTNTTNTAIQVSGTCTTIFETIN